MKVSRLVASSAPTAGTISREARRARFAVGLCFVILGSAIGGWSARIPQAREAVALGTREWGLANLASTAGQLLSLIIVTALIGRLNSRRLVFAAAFVLLFNMPVLAAADTVTALVVGLAIWGFAGNLLATPMNVLAIEVELAYGRSLMSSFHAAFSLGVLGGGLLGTAAAATDVSVPAQMVATCVILGLQLVAARRWLPAPPAAAPGRTDGGGSLRERLTPQLMLLAFMAFLASLVEGSAGQWSAIYTTDSVRATPAVGAVAYTCLVLAACAIRLGGDRITDRVGSRRFLQVSSVAAAAGLGLALVVHSPTATISGMVFLGLGTGCAIPIIFQIAGRQEGLTSGEGVSIAVAGQWPSYVLGPVLIGLIADATSLRLALTLLIVALLVFAALARNIEAPY